MKFDFMTLYKHVAASQKKHCSAKKPLIAEVFKATKFGRDGVFTSDRVTG
jgi:hypothetical protein